MFGIFKKNSPEEQLDFSPKEKNAETNLEQDLARKQSEFEDLLVIKGIYPETDGSFPLEKLVELIKNEIEKEKATCGEDVEYCDQISAVLVRLNENNINLEGFLNTIKSISPKTQNPILKTALNIANQ